MENNSSIFSIADKTLDKLSSEAFGLNYEIEDNPLKITDETIKDFLEDEEIVIENKENPEED